jgi:hypothetical protein
LGDSSLLFLFSSSNCEVSSHWTKSIENSAIKWFFRRIRDWETDKKVVEIKRHSIWRRWDLSQEGNGLLDECFWYVQRVFIGLLVKVIGNLSCELDRFEGSDICPHSHSYSESHSHSHTYTLL